MNRLSPFVQKVVYICLIVGLLIPLSFIARPATQRSDTGQRDAGGQLAVLRNQYNLAQASLGEVDPASETMKLMSLGFRSVAATSLWLNAIDAQVVKDWDRFAASLNTLIKIQPNFHKVWEYQAHNMAYNTSVEFDDYEQRYSWVKKGLDLLRRGWQYNQRDHRFTDWLGRFTGQKIGRSDEKVEFRQLFRHDDDYHASLDDLFDRDSYDAGQYGKDNWLLAFQWFNISLAMVEQGVRGEKAVLRTKPIMFFMNRPAQLRNHVVSLQREFPPEESFKFKWQVAHEGWEEYGDREIQTAINVPITLNGLAKTEIELRERRVELDKLAPGVRDRLLADIEQKLALNPEAKRLLSMDIEAMTDQEKAMVRAVQKAIDDANKNIDDKVQEAVPIERREEAEAICNKIKEAQYRIQRIDRDRMTINYPFWQQRTLVEMTDGALDAHQAFYDAHEKNRNAVYDDFIRYDAIHGQPLIDKVTNQPQLERGSINEFNAGFKFWADAAKQYPTLSSSALFDIMLEDAGRVKEMVDALGKPWPKDFPFQEYIDGSGTAQQYGLPTSDQLKQMEDEHGLPLRPSLDFNELP